MTDDSYSTRPTALLLEDDEVPEPPSATGVYPGPVWADEGVALSLSDDDEVPEPPSATGIYPEPVWAEPAGQAAAVPLDAAELDTQTIYRILREVAVPFSGDALYSAIATDDPAAGLRYGIVLFAQASGHLGSALRLMQARDAARFAETFGSAADELLAVTNAPGTAARLAFVGGEPLTSPAWQERFRAAGAVEAFQAAQNEEAIEHQFHPMLDVAFTLGLTTDRALAAAYDAVAERGVGGGIAWLVKTIGGPVQPVEAFARLLAAATGAARTRLERLRDSTAFDDVPRAAR
jgi:hypothetical protein